MLPVHFPPEVYRSKFVRLRLLLFIIVYHFCVVASSTRSKAPRRGRGRGGSSSLDRAAETSIEAELADGELKFFNGCNCSLLQRYIGLYIIQSFCRQCIHVRVVVLASQP